MDLSSIDSDAFQEAFMKVLGDFGSLATSASEGMNLGAADSMLQNLLGGMSEEETEPSSMAQKLSSLVVRQTVRDYEIKTPTTGSSDEETNKLLVKRNFIIEERSRALASQSKYYESACIFNELSEPNNAALGTKLLIADCYLQLGRENKASKATGGVRKSLLSLSHSDVNEVMELANALTDAKCHVRALLLFKIASDLYMKSSCLPDEKIEGIFRAIARTTKTVSAMLEPEKSSGGLEALLKHLKSTTQGVSPDEKKFVGADRTRILALDFGIDSMKEMLEDMRAVEGGDKEMQTTKTAWASNYIGYDLAVLGEHAQSIKFRKIGVDAMDEVFGDRAATYKIYGILLHNTGIMLHNQEKYKKAEKVYLRAIEAKEKALDHDGEKDKQHDIDLVRHALRVTRQHLKIL